MAKFYYIQKGAKSVKYSGKKKPLKRSDKLLYCVYFLLFFIVTQNLYINKEVVCQIVLDLLENMRHLSL